ncbi:hypothetical protein DFQ27_000159 [Actinomortierella ambigua]|uniref:Uncharacterized protein n=1 Tax=Actinomortierella ambigua TaxID=1343610 RepID=A0A9P6UA09_9FUNG|nr:hypothetical protein DFQ27_000159 [Actinomortierella ambigua]
MAFSVSSNSALHNSGSNNPLLHAAGGSNGHANHANGTSGHAPPPPLAVTNGHTTTSTVTSPTDTSKPTAPDFHVFHVADKALQDCVDLLEKIRKAVAQAEAEVAGAAGQPSSGLQQQHQQQQQQQQPQPQPQQQQQPQQQRQHLHSGNEQTKNKIGDNAMCSQAPQPVTIRAAAAAAPEPHVVLMEEHNSALASRKRLIGMYTRHSTLAGEGTIGKHVRHLADHYRLLLGTYPGCSEKEWRVDYDRRSRDVPMETDINVAIKVLKGLQDLVHEFDPSNLASNMTHRPGLNHPIALMATMDPQYAPVPCYSTLGRELWFCALHAVHHFAMVKVICGEFGMMDLAAGFGVAPSTLQHESAKKRLSAA